MILWHYQSNMSDEYRKHWVLNISHCGLNASVWLQLGLSEQSACLFNLLLNSAGFIFLFQNIVGQKLVPGHWCSHPQLWQTMLMVPMRTCDQLFSVIEVELSVYQSPNESHKLHFYQHEQNAPSLCYSFSQYEVRSAKIVCDLFSFHHCRSTKSKALHISKVWNVN